MLADHDDGVFGPGDRGVEQAPLKHQGASSGAEREDDPGVLARSAAAESSLSRCPRR
jgi:hypothetical protein